MEGLFGMSVNPKVYEDDPRSDLLLGTFYQQHFNEDFGGLAILREDNVRSESYPGLFLPSFIKRVKRFDGTEGIGYCGPAKEPFPQGSGLKFALCFSGNIINQSLLVRELEDKGERFERKDEIELISKLVFQKREMVRGVGRVIDQIMGAFTFLILTCEGVYAFRDPSGHWPLVLGKKKGAVAIGSSSAGFKNLGFEIWRDVEPGELLLIKNAEVETKYRFSIGALQFCSFFWVYSDFPCGVVGGVSSSLVRKRLGAMAARRDIARGFFPDMVSAVQDSGRFHAIGYHQEFCRQINVGNINRIPLFDEALLKYPYAGRSFNRKTHQDQHLIAHVKQLESAERYGGVVLVECEDSIVRGTQTQEDLGPKLRDRGFKEIHFRVSYPEIYSECPWGKTVKKGEPLASRIPSKEKRIEFLGIDGLEHNTADDVVTAIGLPKEQLCMDCCLR